MIDKHFEEKIQELFQKAIASLPITDMWSMEKNVTSFNHQVEADILIKKGGINFAVVEVKALRSSETLEMASMQARFTGLLLSTPFYFVVTPDEFAYFQSDGKLIKVGTREITELDITSILLSKPAEFDNKKWKESIEQISREVEESTDTKLQKAAILQVLESLKYKENYTPDNKTRKILLTPATEERLFDALLGLYKKKTVCRFTTLNSIFRTINTGKQSMCSIVAMNDKSETSYVGEYFKFKKWNFDKMPYLQSGPNDWNNSFITSCCDIDQENDFTMLRMYADDAKGVCIKYKVLDLRQFPGFILRKVSYQRKDGTHPELDIIIGLLSINVNGYTTALPSMSIWQHFFKPKEYDFEKEVRLLYRKDKGGIQPNETFWILNDEFNIVSPLVNFEVTTAHNTYPLQLEGMTLGPKMREADINSRQLSHLLQTAGLNSLINGPQVGIKVSDITHYR